VNSDTTRRALVDIEVYAPNGRKVYQAFYENQLFAAGVTRTFAVNWSIPSGRASALPGTYTVRIGIFAPGWNDMFAWNEDATTFTVTR
jgi:hypothetical protein